MIKFLKNGDVQLMKSFTRNKMTRKCSFIGLGTFGNDYVAMGGAMLVGGATASLSGGRFWDGVRDAAIAVGLNQLMHDGGKKLSKVSNSIIKQLKELGWNNKDKPLGGKQDIWIDKDGNLYEMVKSGDGEPLPIDYRLNKETGRLEMINTGGSNVGGALLDAWKILLNKGSKLVMPIFGNQYLIELIANPNKVATSNQSL